jgi:hypothetical protein
MIGLAIRRDKTRVRMRRSLVLLIAVAALLVPAAPAVALAVTVPSSKSLGSAATGTATLSAQLGTVTATNSGLVAPNVSAQVSCTAFKTGAGTSNETIPCADVFYWSGTATSQSGLSSNTPGQADAAHKVALGTSQVAFSAVGLLLSISISWNPTVIINIPTSAVAGTYTGTITHSVA